MIQLHVLNITKMKVYEMTEGNNRGNNRVTIHRSEGNYCPSKVTPIVTLSEVLNIFIHVLIDQRVTTNLLVVRPNTVKVTLCYPIVTLIVTLIFFCKILLINRLTVKGNNGNNPSEEVSGESFFKGKIG